MLNGFFVLSENGEVLIQKEFLPSLNGWKPDVFGKLLRKNNLKLPPCVQINKVHFYHMFCDRVFLVVSTEDENASPFIICDYLEKLCLILRDFLGVLNPESIFSNVGLVYEVICETADAGFPKLLDIAKIKPQLCNAVVYPSTKSTDLISFLPENLFGVVEKEKRQLSGDASKKPLYDIKSSGKNKGEVYVDLIETLSVIISQSGTPVLCNILGKLNIKSYLERSAEVKIAFPPHKSEFTKAVFNPSVLTDELPHAVKVTASPGNLEVMSYNVSKLGEDKALPFTMYTNIVPCIRDKTITLNLKVYCGLPVRHPAVNVVGKISLPESTASVTGKSSLANVNFKRDEINKEFNFTSPLFPGTSHHSVTITIYLSFWTPAILFELSSIVLQFEVPMLCHSDMKIAGLKVQELQQSTPGQAIGKWVRYLTHSSSYEFRLKSDWYPSDYSTS